MSKKSTITNITPLPAGMTRQAAVAFLQDHLAMVDLNPLVIDRQRIPPPDHALPEERTCTWYLITDKISYLPGGLVKGSVSYSSAFLDLAGVGLQTHCYAPMGVDIRSKWMVCGSEEAEGLPAERAELGVETPAKGLYLREETEVRCSVVMARFVKKTLKDAHVRLAEKLAVRGEREARETVERERYLGTAASVSSSNTTNTNTNTSTTSGLQVPGHRGSRDGKLQQPHGHYQRPLSWGAATEESLHKSYAKQNDEYPRNANEQHQHHNYHHHQQQQQYHPHTALSGGVSNGMYELGGGVHNNNPYASQQQHVSQGPVELP